MSERMCPKHQRLLKLFEGTSKKTGKPYKCWKCTTKTNDGFCDVVVWEDVVKNIAPKIDDPIMQKLILIEAKIDNLKSMLRKEVLGEQRID